MTAGSTGPPWGQSTVPGGRRIISGEALPHNHPVAHALPPLSVRGTHPTQHVPLSHRPELASRRLEEIHCPYPQVCSIYFHLLSPTPGLPVSKASSFFKVQGEASIPGDGGTICISTIEGPQSRSPWRYVPGCKHRHSSINPLSLFLVL